MRKINAVVPALTEEQGIERTIMPIKPSSILPQWLPPEPQSDEGDDQPCGH